jgi:outer membrane protein assembly factor BamB
MFPRAVCVPFLIAALLILMPVRESRAGEPFGGTLTEKRPTPKPFSLIVDDEVGKKLAQAKALLDANETEKAQALISEIFEMKSDPLVCLLRETWPTESTWEYIHASVEAANLIKARLVPFNKLNGGDDGATAKKVLQEVKESKSRDFYLKSATRYLWCDAGAVALRELADSLWESGDYGAAAVYYERLVQSRRCSDEVVWTPKSLFQATVALHRAGIGDQVQRARLGLLERVREEPLVLGKRKVKYEDVEKELKEAEKELSAQKRKEADVSEVVSGYGGSASRTKQGLGGIANLTKPLWTMQAVREPRVREALEKYQQLQLDEHQPVLPGFFQVTGNVYSVPVVVYPSYTGVHCVKAQDGKLKWEQEPNLTPDRLAGRGAGTWAECQNWLQAAALEHRQSDFWENSLTGCISRDNRFIFAVQDFYFFPPKNEKRGKASPSEVVEPQLSQAHLYNQLSGYELTSGKIVWTLGGPGGDKYSPADLQKSYFLSSPLSVGDKVYVLTEKYHVIRLFCLDTVNLARDHNPTIVWRLPLGEAGTGLWFQPERHMHAAHISFDDGILVCQTNTGAVLGVEPVSRNILWAHIYRDKEEPPAKPDPEKPSKPRPHWHHSAPMIQDGKVIVAPPDADALYCLSLRYGSVLWQVPRADDDLYVAGIFDDKVLVIGSKSVKAYKLSDGKAASQELATGMPSGQGTASKNIYYLPLRHGGADAKKGKPEVCVIDIAKGTVKTHLPCQEDDVPGNLLFFNDMLLSQTIFKIAAYPLEK